MKTLKKIFEIEFNLILCPTASILSASTLQAQRLLSIDLFFFKPVFDEEALSNCVARYDGDMVGGLGKVLGI